MPGDAGQVPGDQDDGSCLAAVHQLRHPSSVFLPEFSPPPTVPGGVIQAVAESHLSPSQSLIPRVSSLLSRPAPVSAPPETLHPRHSLEVGPGHGVGVSLLRHHPRPPVMSAPGTLQSGSLHHQVRSDRHVVLSSHCYLLSPPGWSDSTNSSPKSPTNNPWASEVRLA